MSAIAESVRMTRYSMSCTELPLKLLQRLPATGFYVRASSTDPRKCLPCVHLLQQPLVGGRILQNHLRLTVHRKDQWNTLLLQLGEELRVNVQQNTLALD